MIQRPAVAAAPTKKHSKKTGQNDSNNNFNTYRATKKRTVVPEPCNACGRPEHPERFHSHPEAPARPAKKMDEEKKVPVKNSVQKPVAIRYKSRAAEKKKDVQSPRKPASSSKPEPPAKKEDDQRGAVESAKGPRTVTCYICGREFGTMSLPLHEPKCLEKWERENSNLPPELRRKRPVKPEKALSRQEYNNYAWEAAQASLVPCDNCKRTFYPDRLVVHQRSCKPHTQPPSIMSKFRRSEEPKSSSSGSAAPLGQKGVVCNVCGRLFGTQSIKFHEPHCLKKWHVQNDHLPPNKREPMYSESAQTAAEKKAPETPAPQERVSSGKKPPMFPCYLCGRLFSVNSIYIHEPQCLKRWKNENEKLPPHKRKPIPLKPDIKFTPSGSVDFVGTFHRVWENHLAELIECRKCGRKFFPDRIDRHETACAGIRIDVKRKSNK